MLNNLPLRTPTSKAALDLKLAHTRRVSDAIKDIGKSEGAVRRGALYG